jgi:hypothetical protein
MSEIRQPYTKLYKRIYQEIMNILKTADQIKGLKRE